MLIVCLWAVGYLWFAGSVLFMGGQRGAETTDAIVVLTGGNNRIKTGLDLFAKGRALHLFITGVHPQVSKDKILAMWDGDTALPPCCITIDRKAVTTSGNAKETRQWLEENNYASIRLVTSNYHMRRALIEFRQAMPDADIIAHPVPQRESGHGVFKFIAITFSEYHKTIVRWLQSKVT